MKPFYRLHPYYRHGKDTPWGGDALCRVFGKDIPDDRTGEALEASTLPGRESTTGDGRTLTEIAGGPLPLLLKLLDAREALSVQVHPDDAYAGTHEGGKLGKTEAWLVLHAEPGAKLVYGLTPGTDVGALHGQNIESHLRWIEVHKGDVLYIPAGMVHAIGPGILLYEIQQTSDVTYRFWDWDRRDKDGNPRELHWNRACEASRPELQLAPAQPTSLPAQGGKAFRCLNTPHFMLDRLQVETRMPLPKRESFQFLTALSPCVLRQGSETLPLSAGDTAYLPPQTSGLEAEGPAELLISTEGERASGGGCCNSDVHAST